VGVYNVPCSSGSASGGSCAYSKPRFSDFSYTAESNSCLYRSKSSSRPKSTVANGVLLTVVDLSEALLGDIIDAESVAGEDLFMRAAMPAGLTRRRRGLRSAKPDVDGRVVARMARMAKVNEVRIRFIIAVVVCKCCMFRFCFSDFMRRRGWMKSEWDQGNFVVLELGAVVHCATQSHAMTSYIASRPRQRASRPASGRMELGR
jgi:hypothetical protein